MEAAEYWNTRTMSVTAEKSVRVTEIYRENLCIQSECGKTRTRTLL